MKYAKKGAGLAKKSTNGNGAAATNGHSLDTKEFQERMRKIQYAQLPINSFSQITASKKYELLPVSNDPSLLNAIEQANEEYEEDESVRDLAVRILTAFRNRNSVEALLADRFIRSLVKSAFQGGFDIDGF